MAPVEQRPASSAKTLPKLKAFDGSFLDYVKFNILCLVCLLIVLIIVPFLLPISLLFRFYRHFLIHKIKQKYGQEGVDIASNEDSIWLQDSAENRAIINTVMLMKGTGGIDKFKESVDKNLVKAKNPDDPGQLEFPKIRQYPSKILHRYVWIPEANFNLSDHFLVHDRCMPKTKEQLELIIGQLSSQPLPEKRSPWQLILIPPNKASDVPDEYCVMFRVHHSMADGISLVRLLLTQIVDNLPDVPVTTQRARFGSSGMIFRALKALYEGPYMIIEKFLFAADRHILHIPKLTGQKLVSWSKPIDLNLIKDIKNQTGTTVNDVLVSCLSGAFAQYFKENASKRPEDILAYIPVDLRNPKSKPKLDNQFVLVFLKLPTLIGDPLTLLDITRRRMGQIKSSPEPLVNSLIMKYCMARLPNWLTQLTFDMFARKCSMVLSNVPGYQTKLTVSGEVIQDIIFWPPQRANVGLGISILSYDNKVRIGVQCDKALMSNPGELVEKFVRQVDLLSSSLKIS